MANTFIQATNNPVANVEQVNQNNVGTQPIQPAQQTQSNTNSVSPITIPIQIQPQIASTGYSQNTGTNNIQSLQTNNQNVSAAPTPQTYNANNTNTNVVDFNQIYSSYQSQYGNNNSTNNTGNSGIKKTSIGTTIVTPTAANLNTVQGQYQSAYSDTINSLIGEMLTQMNNGFQYDPNSDSSLKVATEYAANTTLQSLAGSGVLNSTATAERVARIVSELIPQYEEKAHDRWIEYLGQLADTAQIVMNYDSQQFEYWKDAKDREFKEKEFEYQKEQDALDNAWKRVDELGYVDNNASAILGVPVGTLSGDAREAKEQREFELQKMREQAQIEYENQKALYQLKSEIDKEYADYEYQLSVKYGGSKASSSTSSDDVINSYKKLINNRWGIQDVIDSSKYTVEDNDAVWNYLTNQYASGNLDDYTYSYLVAYYGLTTPETFLTNSTTTNSFGYGSGGGFR